MKEEDRKMYISMFERGYTAIGEEKGRMEARSELVKNMLNEGLSIDEVKRYTGLTCANIEELRNL